MPAPLCIRRKKSNQSVYLTQLIEYKIFLADFQTIALLMKSFVSNQILQRNFSDKISRKSNCNWLLSVSSTNKIYFILRMNVFQMHCYVVHT